jgi:hypothetical protein
MRLGEIKEVTSRPSGLTPGHAASAEQPAESRALVALAPAADPREAPGYRQAGFLAHLIAVKDQHPQTRERRRAEPNEALAAYRATAALTS